MAETYSVLWRLGVFDRWVAHEPLRWDQAQRLFEVLSHPTFGKAEVRVVQTLAAYEATP